MNYPEGWKPWGRRKKFRWRWGDGTGYSYNARNEYGCTIYEKQLIFLHPHLRRQEHHDLRWDVEGHELLHQLMPNASHRTIYRLERRAGQILHDRIRCATCADSSRPKSGSRRS